MDSAKYLQIGILKLGYAIITLLDAPRGIKSTFGFNSSGWNATELARKIVESIVLNANLAKRK